MELGCILRQPNPRRTSWSLLVLRSLRCFRLQSSSPTKNKGAFAAWKSLHGGFAEPKIGSSQSLHGQPPGSLQAIRPPLFSSIFQIFPHSSFAPVATCNIHGCETLSRTTVAKIAANSVHFENITQMVYFNKLAMRRRQAEFPQWFQETMLGEVSGSQMSRFF